MTAYVQSDVKFYGESYDVYDVTVQKSFFMKNLEKVEKITFSALLGVCFHMNRLRIKYLSTEKTSKNPRNSAFAWLNIIFLSKMVIF